MPGKSGGGWREGDERDPTCRGTNQWAKGTEKRAQRHRDGSVERAFSKPRRAVLGHRLGFGVEGDWGQYVQEALVSSSL